MSMAFGYVAGLISVWGAVCSATWLVWCRPQFDAKRVERRRVQRKTVTGNGAENLDLSMANGGTIGRGKQTHTNWEAHGEPNRNANMLQRILVNGNAKGKETEDFTKANGHAKNVASGIKREVQGASADWEYYWQPYPDTFGERFGWVMDLLINFRGPGWNWAIPPLPPLPPSIKLALAEPVDEASVSGVSHVGLIRIDTRRELFNTHIPRFTIGYFLLDVLKVVMMKDPYFIFGPNTYALPAHLATLSHFQLQMFRTFLNCSAIIVSLEMVFSFAPIVGSLLLGPRSLGLRGEPYYYATTWGSVSNITNKGLNGLWGGWWHQIFRHIFAAPTNYLVASGYVKVGSLEAKLVALLFAFSISSFLHIGGSISQFPRTHPWHPPFFFVLQALGILIQMAMCSCLYSYIKMLPNFVRQAGNFAFTFTWLFYTSWWLTDDFARGGIWLYEPIPISPLRGFGFGDKGDGWWCWEHIGVGWYSGKHWWECGIYI